MTEPHQRTFANASAMLGALFVLFACGAAILLLRPAPSPVLLGACLAAMTATGVLGIRFAMVRAREADLALGEGERYLERIAELGRDLHAIVDPGEGSFLYVGPACEDLLGFRADSFMEGGLAAFHALVHPEDLPVFAGQLDLLGTPPPAGEEEPVVESQFRIRNHHGAWQWVRARRTAFVRYPDGRPAEVLMVVQDVTRQRSFEAALAEAHKTEGLGALVRGTVHDLNNTLMGIQGFTEIALEGHQPADVLKNSLESVQAGIQRASGLCRQILAYSGQGRIQISAHQLNDAVRESLGTLETFVPEGAHLVLDLQSDLPPASVDLTQARHALLILAYNASQALGIRGGEITIRTLLRHLSGQEPEAQGLRGDFVCLEVRDTGPGTAPDVVADLFDPLFTTLHPGRGLGLSTVKGILAEHQGAVHMKAEPGVGDAAALFFPVAEKAPSIDEGDEGTPLAGLSGVLLLVDDEPTIREILHQGFENAGFKVIEAADGVEGFAAFVRHRSSISAVLLDLTMPRMGGDEVFEEIHKLAPEVPVVLMSGYNRDEATAALAGRGLAGFLSKPCSIKEALAAVVRAMGPAAGA